MNRSSLYRVPFMQPIGSPRHYNVRRSVALPASRHSTAEALGSIRPLREQSVLWQKRKHARLTIALAVDGGNTSNL
ncbi:hypothetical protein ZHAS_00009460 [Anopheles sinensis]|uniref:Uncharacterized protein n=1 Tax=Anopheles sinensis TaxID=74873 RepID=A0A084VVA6_ANOSI|nr:hypothetical protein ZHAS_00009460 [Anopheles sinensis]